MEAPKIAGLIFAIAFAITALKFVGYSAVSAIQCVDHNNNVIDWFTIYKIPDLKEDSKLLDKGLAYTFLTSDNYDDWTLSNLSINDSNSILGLTLKPLYNNRRNILYILYNDEPPTNLKSSYKGHTKGVILADSDGGIWLVHSVPKFPSLGNSYTYPSTGTDYGQSFLCISFDLKNLDIVGTQLQYNQPLIYAANIPAALRDVVPNLSAAARNVTIRRSPWNRSANLTSVQGTNFVSFAKSKKFGKDLYADWVSVVLRSSLDVETWPNGRNRLNSSCDKQFKVYNVESVALRAANVNFTSTRDHSKWAVSQTAACSWVCVGDINRMQSQAKRGGGTVCVKNKKVAALYRNSVTTVQKCLNKKLLG